MTTSVGKKIIGRLREFTDALESGVGVSEQFTCSTVVLDLPPSRYSPELVKRTRKLLGVSQAIFAQFLGVSPQTVRAWEQGVNPPKIMACRLMDEIRHDPAYWQRRLRELAVSRVVKKPRRLSRSPSA